MGGGLRVDAQERFRLLYEVTALRRGTFEEKVCAALETVTRGLELQTGFLSRIEEEKFTFTHVYGPTSAVKVGAVHELKDTYCSLVLTAGGVKSINEVTGTPYAKRTSYTHFRLESYLGAAVYVHGSVFGTVCFCSEVPRQERFTAEDEEFVTALARWAGVAIELREAEQRLQESESHFRVLAEAAFEAVAVLDQGKIADVNDSFCKLFGSTSAEAVGRNFVDFVARRDSPRVRERLQLNDEQAYEVTCRRQDGSVFLAEARMKDLESESGEMRVVALHDITDRKRTEARLRGESLRDPLTGIRNQAAFVEALNASSERCKRYSDYHFAVLFIDVDRFKFINETMGHHIGDHLLILIAERLVASVRGLDVVARLGGDEFVILLDGVRDSANAASIAEEIQKELAWPYYVEDREVNLTVSTGVAMNTTSLERPGYLIRNADAAMYRAKSLGRGSLVVFDESLREEATTLRVIEANLGTAVAEELFELHYQPIVRLSDGTPIGYEALLRWPQEGETHIGPSQFIPVAEETGLIVPLGYWVLEQASNQLRDWQQRSGNSGLNMHVNLSAKQFRRAELSERMSAIAARAGVDPCNICLEVTEGVLMVDSAESLEILGGLRAAGFRLYLDDFGTGYSSLSYLHRFPLDALKVDQSLVSEVDTKQENARIVESVLALAASLELGVVAEGIERVEQANFLAGLPCEYGQGFHFGRPQAAAEVNTAYTGRPDSSPS